MRRSTLSKARAGIVLAQLVAVLCLLASLLYGQTQNGNIVGTVRDPSGAVIPNATVSLEEQATKLSRSVVTAEDGTYRFALVPLGDYTLSVEHSGFKRFVNRDVHLMTNQTLRADVTLEVGATTQEVTVEARAAAITTDSAEISNTLPRRFLANYPGGQTDPAMVQAGNTVASNDGGLFTFYGSRHQSTTFTVDGQAFNYYRNYIVTYSVQEVKAEILVSPAKYKTPVTINLATKQGSNILHGDAEVVIQNRMLEALPSPRVHPVGGKCGPNYPCSGVWLAGFGFSGPVYIPKLYDGRNKTFWMLTYAPQKNAGGIPNITSHRVPTPELRSGDVRSLIPLSGKRCAGVPCLINPFTGQQFTDPNSAAIFPTNAASQKILGFYPQPDVPTSPSLSTTWKTEKSEWHTWSFRADQNIAAKDRLSFTLTRMFQVFGSIAPYGASAIKGYGGLRSFRAPSGTFGFGWTRSFSPSIVNEARFGWNYEGPYGSSILGVDTRQRFTDWGLTGVPDPRVRLTVTGPNITGLGFTSLLGDAGTNIHTLFYHVSDNLSIQSGRHTIQTGAEYKFSKPDRETAGTDAWPAYNFDGRFTGNGYADFLLGLPGTITRTNFRPRILARRRSVGGYLQDDWRVSTNLTLNLGIRYDYFAPQWDANGLHFNFDPKTGSLVVPSEASLAQIDPAWPKATNPIVTAAQAGLPSRLAQSDANNFYPRIGFAYRPFNNQNTVVRGGYGIYIVPDSDTGGRVNTLLYSGGPFALATTFDNAWDTAANKPLLQWPVGYPAAGGTFRGLPSVDGITPQWRYPYTQQWNFTLERALGRHGLRLSYIGTKDTNLGYRRDINLPPPSTTPFTSSRYVWPAYRSILYTDNGGTGVYHSFETVFTAREFFGITGDYGYAWAKQIADVPVSAFEGAAGTFIQNPYCRRCERAKTEVIPSHRFYAKFLWELPVGRGMRYASAAHPVLNHLIGGWNLSSTLLARTGLAFNPTFTGSDPSGTNTFSGRPDLIANPNLPTGQRSDEYWYNVKAFAVPSCAANSPTGQCWPIGRFGNSGRNVVDGPGMVFMTLGVFKNFPIKERLTFRVGTVCTNILNHPNWVWGRPGWYSNIPAINAQDAGRMFFVDREVSTNAWGPMRICRMLAGFRF